MSQFEEIMQVIQDEDSSLEMFKDNLDKIMITNENIDKIQKLENMIDIHQENIRRIKQLLRLKTRNYYMKKMLKK